MNQIQQITNDSRQRQTLPLVDGTFFSLELYYSDMQQGWFINELTYKAFTLQGVRITNSPNILHQFRNRIPFGLKCKSQSGREPMLIDDFSSGASMLFVLTQDECSQFNRYLANGQT